MPSEAEITETEGGLIPASEGWFVLNAREGLWKQAEKRGSCLDFEGPQVQFEQVGVALYVLGPGEHMGMYHWEADQEDFLVLAGEALLVIEDEERPLRRWDFVHCPPGTSHTILGAGDGPCTVLALGARDHQDLDEGWGAYPVSEVAQKHDASSPVATSDAKQAYARFGSRESTPDAPELEG